MVCSVRMKLYAGGAKLIEGKRRIESHETNEPTDGGEHPSTITSSGEMTFTSATEGYYSATKYESTVLSPEGMGGPFKISK